MRVPLRRAAALLAASLVLTTSAVVGAQVADGRSPRGPTRILVLFGSPPEAPGTAAFTRALRRVVRDETTAHVDFDEEYLDLEHFTPDVRARRIAERYRGVHFDAVVAVGSVALRFASEHIPALFPRVPVVYGIATDPLPPVVIQSPLFTGRRTPLAFGETLAMARRLQPGARRLLVISGLSARDSVVSAAAIADIDLTHDDIQLGVRRGLPFEALRDTLHRLSPHAIVLLAYARPDPRGGRAFVDEETVAMLARESAAPLYAIHGSWLGTGIVGGAIIDFEHEGELAGERVMRVLHRAPGEALPASESAIAPYTVDFGALRRWGLSERRLPPGTEVRYRTRSTWEQYRPFILGSLTLLATQAVLIGLLLIERRRRVRAQRDVADQAAYERVIAELTIDAVRHAPSESPSALEEALGRIGGLAGASVAVLTEHANGHGPPARVRWALPPTDGLPVHGASRLEVPLVVDAEPIGTLELFRPFDRQGWPPRLIGRIEAAAEVIAGAIARARDARLIRDEEELNRAVLASLSAQIAILDHLGTIVRVNDAWLAVARSADAGDDTDTLVGASFIGMSYIDECHRAEARGCQEAREVRLGIEGVLAGAAGPIRVEYYCPAPNERWYEATIDRLGVAGEGAIVTHLEITERRLAELRLDEGRRQVAHLGRVAMIGELSAAIAHELSQPIAAIRANAVAGSMLLSRMGVDGLDTQVSRHEALEIFKDVIDDALRASKVVEQVRMLLRKEKPRMTTVDLNAVCRTAAHLLRRDATLRGVRVELALAAKLPPIKADPVQLQQMVINLTLNALDATTTVAGERHVVIGTRVDGGGVELYVRDNGRGLSPEVQARLFESFFSTKSEGLGMGLSIVRSIAERHQGRVHAENVPTGGASFHVHLPVR